MFKRTIAFLFVLLAIAAPTQAYIDVTPTLGRLIKDSTNIVVLRVEKVSLEKKAILFHKVADLKGQTSSDPIRHEITAGFHPREPATILEWAEPGQLAISFQNDKVAEICIGRYWYECTPGPEGWWKMNCGQAQLGFAYSGAVSKLREHIETILTGKETVITAVKFTADDAYWRACKRVIAMRDVPQGNQFPMHRFKASLQMADFIYGMARDPKFIAEPGAAGVEEVPALVAALKDQEWQTRLEAAQTLGAIGPAAKEAAAPLRQALTDAKELVRVRAAEAVTAIDPASTEAVPVLAALLKSPDAKIRKSAAQALGNAGLDAPASVTGLTVVAADSDAKVRWAAVEALSRFGAAAAPAVPALIQALQDADPIVRSAAVDALGSIGPKAKAALPVLTALLQGAEISLRPTIAGALYSIDRRKASAAIPVLIDELKETDTRLRWHALHYLRKMVFDAKDAIPVPLLIDALGDSDYGVRGLAAWILGEIGPKAEPAVPALTRALAVNDVWVRITSGPALVKILGGKATMAVPTLIYGLGDQEEDSRRECLLALKRLGPNAREALPTLHRLVKKETRPRALVAETIWRVSQDADVPRSILIQLAKDKKLTVKDRDERLEALHVLGDMGPQAKIGAAALQSLLDEDDAELREIYLDSLRRIDPAQWAQVAQRQNIGWIGRLAAALLLALMVALPLGYAWRAEPRKGPG